MHKSKAAMMKDMRARRKREGLVEFHAWVDPIRHAFLARMVDEPLCEFCGREEALCCTDPCVGSIQSVL